MNEQPKLSNLILRAAAFLLILLLMLVGLGNLLQPKDNQKDSGLYKTIENSVNAHGFLAEPDNTLDVVFLGDSETYSSIVPLQLWEEHGITSYVCSTGAQKLFESCNLLEMLLEHQSPKVVVVETNEIFRRCTPEDSTYDAAANLLPIFRYHDRWKTVRLEEIGSEPNYTNHSRDKGYSYNTKVMEADNQIYMVEDSSLKKVPAVNYAHLMRLNSICQRAGVQLVFLSTPSTKNWNYQKHNRVESLAQKLDCTYIDLNTKADELEINWKKDSRDGGDHMNYRGAQKVTKWIGTWLSENGSLPDRSNDPVAEAWNAALKDFQNEVAQKNKKKN